MIRRLRLCVLALLVVPSIPVAAGEAGAGEGKPTPEPEAEVLIPKSSRNGGWGAPVVYVTSIRDRTAVVVGGRGGWLIDGRLTLGGGGFGLASEIAAPAEAQVPGEQQLDLAMGYGGAWLEYTFAPLKLLHLSVGTLVGGGTVSLKFHDGGSSGSGNDGFFVMEPTAVAELNLASFARLDLGVAYRWIVGVDTPGLSDSDVAGFSALLAVKFGSF